LADIDLSPDATVPDENGELGTVDLEHESPAGSDFETGHGVLSSHFYGLDVGLNVGLDGEL